ncbi:MAG TPA: zinc-binding dehydrogenase [Spirochaetia bacterium]|nr:zinc-binding dehydrogenase [Spirochaetia bacterium]
MHAVQLTRVGSPLEDREIPIPDPGANEIVLDVKAAGICHSDAHYRAGTSPVAFTPITPGHEVAGIVSRVGANVRNVARDDRVALHYLLTCGECEYCTRGLEQFCLTGRMIGKHANGGFAEYIVVPAKNAIPMPDNVTYEAAAIMMCSSATAFHALRQAGLSAGESIAIFGTGGLGMSAVQLSRIAGASFVFAVDIDETKLRKAESYGARPVNAARTDPVAYLRDVTAGRGVDVAVEFAGLPLTQGQAISSLAVHGRAALAGITSKPLSLASYAELINREALVIGVSDHRRNELVTIMQFSSRGLLDLDSIIEATVPLTATAINQTLDGLADFRGFTRTVVLP